MTDFEVTRNLTAEDAKALLLVKNYRPSPCLRLGTDGRVYFIKRENGAWLVESFDATDFAALERVCELTMSS